MSTTRTEPRLADLVRGTDRPLFSFEFYPPKDERGERQLWSAIRRLERLRPDFVSVTYGASGSTRERTIEATRRIASETTLRTVAHLTCASQSVEQLRQVIRSYADAGIRDILAIRGDMPGGPTVPWEPHPEGLSNATAMVELIKELGDFSVGVAAFPDIHPEHHDPDLDADILVAKAAAGADYAITQLFYEVEAYTALVARVRARGCDLPIIPGVQPITNLRQIERFADMSGQKVPEHVVAELSSVPEDQVREVGIAFATRLSADLLAAGAPGLHFFTQNRSTATREIYARLRPESDPA